MSNETAEVKELNVAKGKVKAAKARNAKIKPMLKTAAIVAAGIFLPTTMVSCQTPTYTPAPTPSFSYYPTGYVNTTVSQTGKTANGSYNIRQSYGASTDLQVARAYHQMNLQNQREARYQNNDNVRNLRDISREMRSWYTTYQRYNR